MGKKVREYKAGDFIFAKVKGYPAWPARVQKLNGKRYFVYFYGTGETANLPPNMIFDYAENKDKFLTKTVKRRDFNDGVKQIEYDFANNVPLEDVIGVPVVTPSDGAVDESLNDTANDTADETVDTTAVNDSVADESAVNTTVQNETAVEDSDENGALVIDEGNKQKGKKAKPDAKSKDAQKAKEPKTPRGKGKKEEREDDGDKEVERKEEEIVSRSGRKIRPKRYIDEQTEENATLPSPAPKKRRGASPVENKEAKDKPLEKNTKHYNTVSQSELEDLKEPYKPDDAEKDNILIAYLPTGQYIGVKLFQSRPSSFKSENARLQWDKQAASNAVTLKLQLERGQIKPESVLAQLVMDLNLTDEEKTTLDKERETEEKKSRVQFLKTEMKLIELDAKIKTCLCLEKADTELCLKLLDELLQLDVKPLMLLKHPTCVETVKRMRAYVGNTPSWDLSESAALQFSKQAMRIRKLADTLYKNMKELFTTPDGLSFWEFFSERVTQFKNATAKLSADELLEMVHEPLEMSMPTSHNMKSAIDAANDEEKEKADEKEDDSNQKKKTPVKQKKPVNNSTPSKASKRQRKHQEEKESEKEKQKADEQTDTPMETEAAPIEEASNDKEPEANSNEEQTKELESAAEQNDSDKEKEKQVAVTETDSEKVEEDLKPKDGNAEEKLTTEDDKDKKESEEVKSKSKDKETKSNKDAKEKEPKESKESKDSKESKEKGTEESKEDSKDEKEKDIGEPRAKRSRESKKTEAPPPRSPAKRKSKF
ncbi:PC4 and SFRS1-interacting protein isoform X1 [Amyelois transitella]|uniref:PC4 and SFRS1-interacting protein isoform X1 n=1 Tax=Amyelois transitella TaxID=680683 RepID=UPI00298FBAFB|nr:PC4 and SFRS1-interacting protein isoform X1 [Amyelois transitella]XP_060808678.1 PC4 and SFRS1-interacting protein isoform X1 [Amyelois transitella]